MKKFFITAFTCAAILNCVNAQVYVPAASEFSNFGNIDLSLVTAQSWFTNRSSTPGYFSLTGNSTFINASANANINGYVKKYGNTAFTFPVGSGTVLRSLSMSAPSANETYAVAWINGDPNITSDPTGPGGGIHAVSALSAGLLSVYREGQWDWQAISGTGAGLTITVTIPDLTTFYSNASMLRLAGWNGSVWIPLGTTGAAALTAGNTVSGTMQAGISAIAIGAISFTLPLNLVSFDAKADGCKADIVWESELESKMSHYEIQRSEGNADFSTIASVEPQTSGTLKRYEYTAEQTSRISYYRLKMIDQDGAFAYSKTGVVYTSNCSINNISVSPNPVQAADNLRLLVNTNYSGNARVLVIGASGQQIYKQQVVLTGSSQVISLPSSRFAKGSYMVQVTDMSGNTIGSLQQFIKQ